MRGVSLNAAYYLCTAKNCRVQVIQPCLVSLIEFATQLPVDLQNLCTYLSSPFPTTNSRKLSFIEVIQHGWNSAKFSNPARQFLSQFRVARSLLPSKKFKLLSDIDVSCCQDFRRVLFATWPWFSSNLLRTHPASYLGDGRAGEIGSPLRSVNDTGSYPAGVHCTARLV